MNRKNQQGREEKSDINRTSVLEMVIGEFGLLFILLIIVFSSAQQEVGMCSTALLWLSDDNFMEISTPT